MDLSSYLEEEYERSVKSGGVKKEIPLKTEKIEDLTEEAKNLVFFDFEVVNTFIGTFQGEGKEYAYNDLLIKTWAFLDINELPWLIPQWEEMNQPADLQVKDKEAVLAQFNGFQHEEPKIYLYQITYHESAETDSESKHRLTILRKKI